jgi:hypothetical protein
MELFTVYYLISLLVSIYFRQDHKTDAMSNLMAHVKKIYCVYLTANREETQSAGCFTEMIVHSNWGKLKSMLLTLTHMQSTTHQ